MTNRVEDQLAIMQQIARYSHTYDSRDIDAWVSLFTEDGIWESYRAGQDAPLIRLQGPAELLAFAKQYSLEAPEGVMFYHHQSGILFDELTDSHARTRNQLVVTLHGNPAVPEDQRAEARVHLHGMYEDEWTKTSQGWLFARRTLRT
jgi:hypothetical protein